MSKRLLTVMAAMAIVVAGAVPAAASEVAQPTELQPPPDEVPVLYPPEYYGQAHVVILVDEEPILVAWGLLTSLVSDVGAWVSSSTTGSGSIDGREYDYAISVVEVPDYSAGEFLSRLDELGRQVSFDIQAFDSGPLTVVVTLTDDAEPFTGVASPQSRVDRALDTAGDVLLAMLSFLIVAAAVVVPIAVLGLIGFAVWRGARRRWPIEEVAPSPAAAEEEVDEVNA